MRMRAGLEVVLLGKAGRGQVVALDDADAVVFWQRGGKRERHPQSDLVWCGLTVHTCDGRPGRVIELGRERVYVRLSNGVRCWMNTNEFEPRQPKQEVVPEQ